MNINQGVANIINSGETYYNPDGVDYIFYNTFLDSFISVANVVLGIMVYFLAVTTTLIMALEIAYIALPVFHSRINYIKNSKNNKDIFRIAFRDADRALIEANTLHTGQSAMSIYIRHKIKTLVLLGICYMLIMNPNIVFNLASSIVKPIVDVINTIINT